MAPSLSLRILAVARSSSGRLLSTSAQSQTQKLERIADELLDLTKLERHDYGILFSHKMGINRYVPSNSGPTMPSAGKGSSGEDKQAETAEKTVFDVKLEKFEMAAKIKVIKEVRSFTELGLKEAKELVEKYPVIIKKGVAKEEAESILQKLKEAGASAVLE